MKTPDVSTDRARLLAAAAVLRERGHLNATGMADSGPVCIMQALAIADGQSAQDWPLAHVPPALLSRVDEFCTADVIRMEYPPIRVAFYNDYRRTSGADAIEMLELAAAES